MDRSELQQLSKEQLIELVLRLQWPDKNSRTSSKPPSTDKKEKRENARAGGHEPHNRRLADDPDAQKDLIGEYDEIEIPPIKPYVIRHRRFACRCAHCGLPAKAPVPAVATTTPFGPRIHALEIYLKGFLALSYERFRGLCRQAFGLRVSEGALMNMFIRSHPRFEIEAEKAKATVRAAQVVASDETGVRIEGTNSYHWVFHCKDAVVHQPDYSRAARVVDEMMAGHKPAVWISDRYSALSGPFGARLRFRAGARFGRSAPAVQLWLGRAFDLAKAIATSRPSWLREPDAISPGTASQDRARARPACHLLRLSRRGRRHPQHVGAQTAPLRDPAKSHQRLSRHVGRRSGSRRPHNRRYRKAQGRQPLRRDRRHPGLTPVQTAQARVKKYGVGNYPQHETRLGDDFGLIVIVVMVVVITSVGDRGNGCGGDALLRAGEPAETDDVGAYPRSEIRRETTA